MRCGASADAVSCGGRGRFVGCRRGTVRQPPDDEHQHRGEKVQGAGDASRRHEPERSLQHPSGERRARRGADGVHRIQTTDERAGFLDAAHHTTRDEWQGQTHQRCRQQYEHRVERELGRRRRELLGLRFVHVIEQPHARHGEEADDEVCAREREQRRAAAEPVGQPAAHQVAEPQPGEERGDHRGERNEVDAGVQRDHALPDDLQGQGREAGDREHDVEGEPRRTPHGRSCIAGDR